MRRGFKPSGLGALNLKNIAYPVEAFVTRLEAALTAVKATNRSMHSAPDTLPPPHRPSLAVLPFENLSGDPEQEYFADGIVEEIITALARIPSFFVIARNSSFAYKGRPVDVKQVGRELGVRLARAVALGDDHPLLQRRPAPAAAGPT